MLLSSHEFQRSSIITLFQPIPEKGWSSIAGGLQFERFIIKKVIMLSLPIEILFLS